MLTGVKDWIINARHAGLSIVFAMDSMGTGGFVLNAVPALALILPPGTAFAAIPAEINGARAYVAAMRCAMLGAALATVATHGRQRHRLGQPLMDHQAWPPPMRWQTAPLPQSRTTRRHNFWPRRPRCMRGGYGLIVEPGGAQTLPLSLRAGRPGGPVALIGVLSGLDVGLSLGAVVARQVRRQVVTVGPRAGFEAMLAAMAQHPLRPVTGATFDLADLHAALHHQRTGGHFGMTLIRFCPPMPDTHPCQPRFQAQHAPDAIAYVMCATDERVTFARMAARANQGAHLPRRADAGRPHGHPDGEPARTSGGLFCHRPRGLLLYHDQHASDSRGSRP